MKQIDLITDPNSGRIRGISPTWIMLLVSCGVSASVIIVYARDNSVTIDEFAHVPAGICQWERGSFGLYHENPPLVRGIIALPAWLAGPATDYSRERIEPGVRSETAVAKDFMYRNADRYLGLFFRARCAVVALSVASGLLIFHWARRLAGDAAGMICSCLWLFDPNVIGHSSIATLDIGAAFFGLLAGYAHYRFLRDPRPRTAVCSGLCFGLALASKFTMMVLIPAWFASAVFVRAQGREPWPSQRRRTIGLATLALVISLAILNGAYRFSGSFRKLGSYEFVSRLLGAIPTPSLRVDPGGVLVRQGNHGEPLSMGNRFRGTPLAGVTVPLPEDFVQGFDSQKWDEEVGLTSLVDGRPTKSRSLLNPFRTMAYKWPIGTIVLVLIAGLRLIAGGGKPHWADWSILAPPILILSLLCSQTGLNWAIRYSLPAFPFILVASARSVGDGWRTRLGRPLIIACLAWNAMSLFGARSAYLSYGNEWVGGIEGARKVFVGSNFDWGQDLVRLKHWCDEHRYAVPIRIAYYGSMSPRLVGLSARALPARMIRSDELDGDSSPEVGKRSFYAISAHYLSGLGGAIQAPDGTRISGSLRIPGIFRTEDIRARIGGSIYVFEFD